LLGYTREELLGLHVSDIARYTEASGEWGEMLQAGTRVGTSTLTRKDGTNFEFSYIAGATIVAGMPVFVSVGAAT
jgi:hypothetical protein